MKTEPYLAPEKIRTVAVVGAGAVGASWAALFLAQGLSVVAYDPAPGAQERANDFIVGAWPALLALGQTRLAQPPLQSLRFVESATLAAQAGDVIQENAPERPDLKARLLAEIDAAAAPHKIILSSTGGIPPSELQTNCQHPERFVVLHPFNPSHLIPLVEVVGGKQTAPAVIEWALAFARHLGKQPIKLNIEANGHMTNRLQFALVREAIACLLEGIASAKDIDAAVRYGLGPRWTLMGSLLTLHLAGGAGGMKGILDHAGPAIEQWWTPMKQPRLTPDVKARLMAAAQEVANDQPINEWVQWRDGALGQLLALQHEMELTAPQSGNHSTPSHSKQETA